MTQSKVAAPRAEKSSSSQPAGYLLTRFGLLTVLGVMLLAVWAGQFVIVILLALVLSAGGLTRLWSRYSLSGVQCQRTLSERRVFPGEEVRLKLRVVNRKLLPLPWLQLEDEMPASFAPDSSVVPGSKPGFVTVSKTASLLWYSGISWKSSFICSKRGYYVLGPMTVTSGDIFGFYPRSTVEQNMDNIIVYPRVYPLPHLELPSLYPLGDTRSDRRIFEDPSRTIGIRDYCPGDSLRRIHWKASARRQNLQVKVFEPTTTLKVALFFAGDSFSKDGSCDEDNFELGISAVASVASSIAEKGSQVGLWVNSRMADSGEPARIAPGAGDAQLMNILEALAKVTPASSQNFEEFLQAERNTLPHGMTLVFTLSQLSPQLALLLSDLAGSGYKVIVLQIGDEQKNALGAEVAWHNVKKASDLHAIGAAGQW